MDSFDKLMTLCFSVHDLIGVGYPGRASGVTLFLTGGNKGDKHLLNQNRFYYKMVKSAGR